MSTSILFYSQYCSHCKEVIGALTKSPAGLSIKYVCTDSKAVQKQFPFIETVPTLVVGGTNNIIVGKKILQWVDFSSMPTQQSNGVNSIHPKDNPKVVRNNQPPAQTHEPLAWHNNEMNSFSDNYSFLGIDTSAEGNGGISISHNFELLNDSGVMNSQGRQTIPAGSPARPSLPVQFDNSGVGSNNIEFGSIQNSQKSDELNKQMEALMNSRDLDVPAMPRRM